MAKWAEAVPVVVLDEGAWSAYGCDTRIWLVYVQSVVMFVAMFLVAALIFRIRRNLKQGNPVFYSPDSRRHVYRRRMVLGAGMVCSACLAFVPAFKQDMVWLKWEQSMLVETGCRGATRYELRFPRDEVVVGYARIEARRSSARHELSLTWQQRRIVIKLDSSPYLANLALFAPDHLKLYAADLRRHGYSVPPVLR